MEIASRWCYAIRGYIEVNRPMVLITKRVDQRTVWGKGGVLVRGQIEKRTKCMEVNRVYAYGSSVSASLSLHWLAELPARWSALNRAFHRRGRPYPECSLWSYYNDESSYSWPMLLLRKPVTTSTHLP